MAVALVQPVLDFGYRKSCRSRLKRHSQVELIVDNFAGGGGASLGIEQATGRAVDIAVNHCKSALEMHEFNHPATKHYCESVWKIDPQLVCGYQPVGLAWFSPDCRHFSRAKGKKPVSRKIRCLAWIVIRWARKKKPRLIMLENVREFQDWGPLLKDTNGNEYPDPNRKGDSFNRWLSELKRCGYQVEYRILNAADYGAPTHRRRLFVIARSDGKAIKWPNPTHGPGRKPYRTAAECIDWSLPCPSIFDRKKPLAEKTLRRIALGIKRYVLENPKPFVVKVNHGGTHFRGQSIDKPLSTVTGTHGHALVSANIARIGQTGGNGAYSNSVDEPLTTVTRKADHLVVETTLMPHISTYYGSNKPSNEFRGNSADEPLRTQTLENRHALVSALLTKHYGGVVGHELDKPTGTITQVDHHALTTANLIKFRFDSEGSSVEHPMPTITDGAGASRPAGAAHALGIAATTLIRMNHGEKQWSSVDDPLGTVTAGGLKFGMVYAFLTKFFGTAVGTVVDDPLHTITAKERFGLITVKVGEDTYAIADIGMRMLQPHELAKAQGFPDDYVLVGSKSNQVAKIGNSVCPQVAKALVRSNW